MKKISISNKQKVVSLVVVLLIIIASFFAGNIENIFIDDVYNNGDVDVQQNDFKVHFIDVGSEDAIFITQNNNAMLIDAGSGKDDANKIEDYINKLGYSKLDYAVASHWDKDHIGGLIEIANRNSITIDNLLYPENSCSTNTCDDFSQVISEKNSISIYKDNKYKLGDATIEVLWPLLGTNNTTEAKTSDDNNNSIVLMITYFNNKFLFMGDAEIKTEKKLLEANSLKDVDLIKIAHHGSKSSSSEKFINTVKPEYSIIMTNSTEVDKDVLKILKSKGKVYTTRNNGTIKVTSDGNNIKVSTTK